MQMTLMRHKATIKRRTPSETSGIISSGTPASVQQNVSCLIQEEVGMVRRTGLGDTLQYDAVAFLPVGTDIEPQKGSHQTDTLVVESHPTIATGSEFLVLHVANLGGVQSLAAQHLQAYLKST